MEQLDYIINGGETRRYHTWPVLRPQRVDEHSFHVAMLVSMIALDAMESCSKIGLTVPLLMAALTHDLAEHKFGDLPATTKRALPLVAFEDDGSLVPFRTAWGLLEANSLASVSLDWEPMLEPIQLRWLKMADAMQGCLYCIRERQMGNRLMGTVFDNFRSYVAEMAPFDNDPAMVGDIILYIDDMWSQANG